MIHKYLFLTLRISQRLEDAALKDVDARRVSGKVSLGFSKSAEERAQEASPLTVKKREHAFADPLIFAPTSNGGSYSPLKPIKARALPACAGDGGKNVTASSATQEKEMTSPTAATPPTTDEKLQKYKIWRRDDACEVSQMSTQQKPTQQQKPKLQELSKGANIQAASANFLQTQKQGVLQQQAGSTPQGFWWWLEDRHVRDAEMRRPQDDDYDPSTVFIPKNAFATMTDFQKQYWEIKRVNFDMLIMAKLGKFYELYENDAEIAHKLLYLNYTYGGRDPNSKKMLCVGVPENSIDGIVGKLVAQRYKVGIVEEMERASDLKKAQATMGVSSSARKVVDRSLRRIFTPGTISDEELLGGHEPKPLCVLVPQLAASAAEAETLADTLLGVCLIDCSTARINIGTVALHELDVLLRAHRPHEVVYPRGRLHGPLKSWIKNSTPLAVWTALTPGHHDEQFWPADVTRSRIGELADIKLLADLLNDDNEKCNLALNALGGAMAYLKKLRLDRDLLSLRNFHDLHGLGDNGPKCMLLDIQTLNGLDVLEPKGCEGKRSGGMTCLWQYLDRTVTPFGKRLLRWWVTRPLLQVHDIRKRSAAVQDLLRLSGAGSIVSEVEMLMKKLPDLERKVTRIHAFASLHSEKKGIAEEAASQKRACRELVAVMQVSCEEYGPSCARVDAYGSCMW
jgi:DNA mismatch repair protein MSH6